MPMWPSSFLQIRKSNASNASKNGTDFNSWRLSGDKITRVYLSYKYDLPTKVTGWEREPECVLKDHSMFKIQ